MRSRLPVIKALKADTSNVKIKDIAMTEDGLVYIYEIEFDVDTSSYLSNNIGSVRVRALTQIPSQGKTNLESILKSSPIGNTTSVSSVQAPLLDDLVKSGGVAPAMTGEDAQGEYFIETDSSDTKSSQSSLVGKGLSTWKFDLMQKFDSFQKKIDAVTIFKTVTSFEPSISSELTDLIAQIAAASNTQGETNRKPTRRSFGLTGNLSSKQKRVKVPAGLSQDYSFVPVKKSDVKNLYGMHANSIPTSFTFLNDSMSQLGQKTGQGYEASTSGTVRRKRGGKRRSTRKELSNDTSYNLEKTETRKNKELGSTCASVQSAYWKLIMDNGISPASYIPLDINDILLSSIATYQGCKTTTRSELSDSCLATKTPTSKSICNKSNSSEQEALLGVIRDRLVSMPASRLSTVADIPAGQSIPVKVNKTLTRVSSKIEIEIMDSDMEGLNNFTVSIDLLNTSNQIVDNVKVLAQHGRLREDFVDISEPPTISLTVTDEKDIQICVNQIDNDASIIKVFKKQIDFTTLLEGSQYKLIKTLNITSSDSETILYDTVPGTMSTAVVYRAVSYSKIGASGAFADAVFRLSDIVDTTQESDPYHGCLMTTNSDVGIGISSQTIIGEPVNVQIIRRNLSRHEKDFTLIYDAGHPDFSGGKSGKVATTSSPGILDTDVHDGEIYEYRLKSLFIDGSEKVSCSCSIIEYKYPTTGLSLGASIAATANQGSSGKRVSFNIAIGDSTINEEQFLKEFFDSNGLEALYTEEISSMKNELSNILAAKVTRKDLVTNEDVDLGVVQIGEFIDTGPSGMIGGVPKRDRSYEYTIEALVRDPQFLLEEMEKSKGAREDKKYAEGKGTPVPSAAINADGKDINPNYRSKFLSRDTLGSSTIMNQDAILSKKAGGMMEQGKTGVTKKVRIEGNRTVPTIKAGSVRYNRNEQVVISWSMSGTGKNSYGVDYFIVSATRLGSITYPVKVCHGQLSSNKFVVVDDTQSDMVGDVAYSITPVFDDLSLGSSSTIGKVLIK